MTDAARPAQAPPIRTNALAIVSFIAAFMTPVAGIVMGYLAQGQIRRAGEEGRGLARAGVIIGSLGTLLQVGFFIVWFSLFFGAMSSFPGR